MSFIKTKNKKESEQSTGGWVISEDQSWADSSHTYQEQEVEDNHQVLHAVSTTVHCA